MKILIPTFAGILFLICQPTRAAKENPPFEALIQMYREAHHAHQNIFTYLMSNAEALRKFEVLLFKTFRNDPPNEDQIKEILSKLESRQKLDPRTEKLVLRGAKKNYHQAFTPKDSTITYQVVEAPPFMAFFFPDQRFKDLELEQSLIANGKFFLHLDDKGSPQGFEFWVRGTYSIDKREGWPFDPLTAHKRVNWIHVETPKNLQGQVGEARYLDAWMTTHALNYRYSGAKLVPARYNSDAGKNKMRDIHPMYWANPYAEDPNLLRDLPMKSHIRLTGAKDPRLLYATNLGLGGLMEEAIETIRATEQGREPKFPGNNLPKFFQNGDLLAALHSSYTYDNFTNLKYPELTVDATMRANRLPEYSALHALTQFPKYIDYFNRLPSEETRDFLRELTDLAIDSPSPKIRGAILKIYQAHPDLLKSGGIRRIADIKIRHQLLAGSTMTEVFHLEAINDPVNQQAFQRVQDLEKSMREWDLRPELAFYMEDPWIAVRGEMLFKNQGISAMRIGEMEASLEVMKREGISATTGMEKHLADLIVSTKSWSYFNLPIVGIHHPDTPSLSGRLVDRLKIKALEYMEKVPPSGKTLQRIQDAAKSDGNFKTWLQTKGPNILKMAQSYCDIDKKLKDDLRGEP